MNSRCLLLIIFFSSLPTFTCFGVSCYVCMWSSNNDTCGDEGFSLSPEQDGYYWFNCSVCYKKVQFDSKGVKLRILRGCVRHEWAYEPICQSIKYLKGLSMQVCACTSDYCNSVNVKYLSMVTLLLMGVFVYVL